MTTLEILTPVVDAAPGETTSVVVVARNPTKSAVSMTIGVIGVEETDAVARPADVQAGAEASPAPSDPAADLVQVEIPAEGSADVMVPVKVPKSFGVGKHSAALRVTTSAPEARPFLSPFTIDIVSVEGVELFVTPSPLRARRRKRFSLHIDNNKAEAVNLTLSGGAPDVRVKFKKSEVQLNAGEKTILKGRVKGPLRFTGDRVQHSVAVTAAGKANSTSVIAPYIQKSLFGRRVRSVAGALAIIGFWAGGLFALAWFVNPFGLSPITRDTETTLVDGAGDAVAGDGSNADGTGADGAGADGTGADAAGADGVGADGAGADGAGADGAAADGAGAGDQGGSGDGTGDDPGSDSSGAAGDGAADGDGSTAAGGGDADGSSGDAGANGDAGGGGDGSDAGQAGSGGEGAGGDGAGGDGEGEAGEGEAGEGEAGADGALTAAAAAQAELFANLPQATMLFGTVGAEGTEDFSDISIRLAPIPLGSPVPEELSFVDDDDKRRRTGGKIWSARRGAGVGSFSLSRQTEPVEPLIAPIDGEGVWTFNDVALRQSYELVFSKPGYQTQSFVISPPADGSPIEIDVVLVAADGSLEGVVTDAAGELLGGVMIQVSNGTLNFTTTTETDGDVGAWRIEGLTTPEC